MSFKPVLTGDCDGHRDVFQINFVKKSPCGEIKDAKETIFSGGQEDAVVAGEKESLDSAFLRLKAAVTLSFNQIVTFNDPSGVSVDD